MDRRSPLEGRPVPVEDSETKSAVAVHDREVVVVQEVVYSRREHDFSGTVPGNDRREMVGTRREVGMARLVQGYAETFKDSRIRHSREAGLDPAEASSAKTASRHLS
eukprot:CAMPEP_0167780664 /NCGR_PEP_ID=MMETSP0111_2-20121227/5491_1 /TAXON_ID=91324 /ORGANISM="Lotharella globosa, Strain CCCM811" /LENGTH=106 /DNA_ID=CAMNT_0007671217 /DNA_START=326 /DNA_END=647 /DNA_ORIENTATION=+